ncbi:precorrin-6A reductase [Aureimonas endophytica]|uniref:Precorrin-6A reductase n=1 Tax=Aureimonas endophytica TaxID=2027858 RepID=A0A917EAV8_9HYPH|nr:cobalt-precorrin-6A reductase [Aureimonas endophytica]GGE17117.1 precorrin-6A reductase [Aureimonas endophytica]
MPADTILLLGGTAEANALARRIAAEMPATRLIVSLAGRTASPQRPADEVRIGGFGGSAGLAHVLRAEGVTRLVDATHPFAIGISRAAAEAAERAGVPRLALQRPAWEAIAGDDWHRVPCLKAAAASLPAGATVFLALGRQHLAPFAARPDLRFVTRMVEPPAEPLPFPARLVFGKPGEDWRAEAALLAETGADWLVSRNSGGAASYAKIEAARRLGLPVTLIERMAAPAPPVVATIAAVMDWLGASA